MQLYKTTWHLDSDDGDDTLVMSWQGSQTEASKARSAAKKDGMRKVETQTVNVPTAKGPLLEWLNHHHITAK